MLILAENFGQLKPFVNAGYSMHLYKGKKIELFEEKGNLSSHETFLV